MQRLNKVILEVEIKSEKSGKLLLRIGKNLSEARCQQTRVVYSKKQWVEKGGVRVMAAVQTQENFAIFTFI